MEERDFQVDWRSVRKTRRAGNEGEVVKKKKNQPRENRRREKCWRRSERKEKQNKERTEEERRGQVELVVHMYRLRKQKQTQ